MTFQIQSWKIEGWVTTDLTDKFLGVSKNKKDYFFYYYYFSSNCFIVDLWVCNGSTVCPVNIDCEVILNRATVHCMA